MTPTHDDVSHHWADQYLMPVVLRELDARAQGRKLNLIDVGCGDGYAASCYAKAGHLVKGFDVSTEEVARAQKAYPGLSLEVGSLYDDALIGRWGGSADVVTSLEVVEHLFEPKKLFSQSLRLLRDQGVLLLSTPYHGYAKNLAMSLLDRWDRHHTVEWDGGHIKFFSEKTLGAMAEAAGFRNIRMTGVGRFPYFWKSTVLVAQK